MAEREKIIEVSGLIKSYKNVKAVQGIDFVVKKGELFAFLGVNGAGKSTTINIICGRLNKDEGTVFVNGHDIDKEPFEVKNKIGVVFQQSVLDQMLTVKQNLESRAALYNLSKTETEERIRELDKMLDLKPILKQRVSTLSGGQRRRVDVARALVNSPDIIILDEPTTGLDPQTRKTVWSVFDVLRREQGKTIFLTTHYMEEAAEADYVVIIDNGKIVAHDTPLNLKTRFTGDFITLYNVKEDVVKELGLPYQSIRDGFKIAISNTEEASKLIIKYSNLFVDYEVTKGKMDDVFLAVTGKKLMEGEK